MALSVVQLRELLQVEGSRTRQDEGGAWQLQPEAGACSGQQQCPHPCQLHHEAEPD